jgi:glyoxylase-like metal-dependent hydrolase (beta-lactamase superfamily II)
MKITRLATGAARANCYFCLSGEELALIDPGDDALLVLEKLRESGQEKPGKIILTHYHYDHARSVPGILEAIGPVPVWCHEADEDRLDFSVSVKLRDRDRVPVGEEELKVLSTPGHSEGSICLLGDGFIFTGDTVFRDGYGRTDLPGGSEEVMSRSLKGLQAIFRPGLKVYPGHGEAFEI